MAQAMFDDAQLLLDHQRYSSAYYLAGYAIELSLKACIARSVAAETIPDKSFIKGMYSHQFVGLAGLAGLTGVLNTRKDGDATFAANWALASEWEPDARYELTDAASAQALVLAVGDPKSGVLQWIKAHW